MSPTEQRILYVVVSAAPPAQHIHELLGLLHLEPQLLVVVTTPVAATWIDESRVRLFTSWPLRTAPRQASEAKVHPPPGLVIAAPLTFNTINKWAAGINDNPALGVLNEALGEGIPIIASPMAKTALAAHPAFVRSLAALADAGVTLTAINALAEVEPGLYRWQTVLDALAERRRES